MELRLEGTNQCVGQPVEKGKAVFKLPCFTILLPNLLIQGYFASPVFWSRDDFNTGVSCQSFTRWTVENEVVHSSIEDGNLAVKLTWTQTGFCRRIQG